MIIGNSNFTGGTHVMAIINLTPDSFWQNSRATADTALFAAEKAVSEGAEILDLGAQSTRPGYKEVSAAEEIFRFLKPMEEIKKRFPVPVSVDTYYTRAASAALDYGADMINDVWGLTYGEGMADTIAKHGASVCIMHNAKTPLSGDIWQPIINFLQSSSDLALASGIDKNKICLDGGIGFAKDSAQNFELLTSYERLSALGYPLLLGTSRKSMFGGDVKDRLEPTLQTTRLAVKKGIMFVRVHDVKENVQAIREAEYEYGKR
ncbi:MAG: dihydropteroate synthase [Clostridia bacterium]|nr:dihydropteroate synthase [Clostridia bacterium]